MNAWNSTECGQQSNFSFVIHLTVEMKVWTNQPSHLSSELFWLNLWTDVSVSIPVGSNMIYNVYMDLYKQQ